MRDFITGTEPINKIIDILAFLFFGFGLGIVIGCIGIGLLKILMAVR